MSERFPLPAAHPGLKRKKAGFFNKPVRPGFKILLAAKVMAGT